MNCKWCAQVTEASLPQSFRNCTETPIFKFQDSLGLSSEIIFLFSSQWLQQHLWNLFVIMLLLICLWQNVVEKDQETLSLTHTAIKIKI